VVDIASATREIDALKERNGLLMQEVEVLKAKIEFLERHEVLRRGLSGERYVNDLVGGAFTQYCDGGDIVTESGLVLEIKYSSLHIPNPKCPTCKRWTWGRPLGESGNKKYDRLILVGENDARYDCGCSDSPYVVFDVPYTEVRGFCSDSGGVVRFRKIHVTTNRMKCRSRTLNIWNYVTSGSEIQRKYSTDSNSL